MVGVGERTFGVEEDVGAVDVMVSVRGMAEVDIEEEGREGFLLVGRAEKRRILRVELASGSCGIEV